MSYRIPRVNQLIKKELAQIILKEVEFPENVLVTLTRVDTTANLIESRVYISCIPQEKQDEIMAILNQQVWHIQQILNKKLVMRPMPKIIWVKEKETGEAEKVEKILVRLKK